MFQGTSGSYGTVGMGYFKPMQRNCNLNKYRNRDSRHEIFAVEEAGDYVRGLDMGMWMRRVLANGIKKSTVGS